jgi:hypothetical protein
MSSVISKRKGFLEPPDFNGQELRPGRKTSQSCQLGDVNSTQQPQARTMTTATVPPRHSVTKFTAKAWDQTDPLC